MVKSALFLAMTFGVFASCSQFTKRCNYYMDTNFNAQATQRDFLETIGKK